MQGALMTSDLDTKVIPNEIRSERKGSAMVVTLDRGGSLNAISPAMIAELSQLYPRLARDPSLYVVILKSSDPKAFSAGGDVRALRAAVRRDFALAKRQLRAEYALNWLHDCFSKPSVAMINGLVMGSGVGLQAYTTHRVAGPRYRFAMPETAIGFFPDVGIAHILAKLPHAIGMYLGLTGHAIGRADALALGLVTHCLEVAQFDDAEAALAETQAIDQVLDSRHVDPGPGVLESKAALIAHCFDASAVQTIVDRLGEKADSGSEFAAIARADLIKRSPLALKVTHRHLRRAAALDLRLTLEADYRLACRMIVRNDFDEGVRAALIDKDHSPRWHPATLADVTSDMLDDVFAPLLGGENLNLPLRQEMQALRV
jgi:enoyl-CoA hydratase